MRKELVSVDWLKEHLEEKNLVLLDASPQNTIGGNLSDFADRIIPGARVFDIKNKFSNKGSDFPNTLPSESQFEKECQALGIHINSEIVVYDNLGIYTSPRVWWMFKVMGHRNVKVLDGGLPEWIKEGYQTINRSELNQNLLEGNFKAQLNEEYVIRYEDIIENTTSKKFTIVDARSAGRFNGTAPEPRKHLKSGSIPHSVNIPYTTVLNDGKYKSPDELRIIFNSQLEKEKQLVFSCGSGMTACIVLLASDIAFKKSRYLYDGSWTEYASINNGTVTER